MRRTFISPVAPSGLAERARGQRACPDCRRTVHSEDVSWEHVRSSEQSWRMLAGREGYVASCPEHGTRLGHVWTLMS